MIFLMILQQTICDHLEMVKPKWSGAAARAHSLDLKSNLKIWTKIKLTKCFDWSSMIEKFVAVSIVQNLLLLIFMTAKAIEFETRPIRQQ